MSLELLLNFSDANQFSIGLTGKPMSGLMPFSSPLTDGNFQDIRWYLETYGAQDTADVDDDRAEGIQEQLEAWGAALYREITKEQKALLVVARFLNDAQMGRVLTINSDQPSILGLPWELLFIPGSDYLFNEEPSISVRRNLMDGREGRDQAVFEPKEKLHLLFVVSRPVDEGFLDPRLDPQAVMDAIDLHGQDRISVEFLRPATTENLRKRLANRQLPAIDILHFDGHGTFDGQVENSKTPLPAGKEQELLRASRSDLGYLVFEDEDRKADLVNAKALAKILNQRVPGLVVLSACQSATVAGETALGSVAAKLTQAGTSTVIAMSYSVLAVTTQKLFGEFYENLVRGQRVGESLDNARRRLISDQKRGERSRGQERFMLRLEDWFVPTLYQSGSDRGMVLVAESSPNRPPAPNSGGAEPLNAIPEPIAGFFGRRQELWQIERAFTPNPGDRSKETRRMTIAGFGGQGKTALAAEAGRWLVRSGMFEAAVFVDYAAFQGTDGVALAVSTIARDLNTNLIDGAAVAGELARRRVLVILDNLEDLAPAAAQGLLTQAIAWSESGQSRVLITTRQGDLVHPQFMEKRYKILTLKGLGSIAQPDDAVDYFQALMQRSVELDAPQLPLPARKALIELFAKVDFHPLSIALVAEQLRTRGIVDVIQALDRLLLEVPAGLGKDRCLVASLNLSLERLDAGARSLVRRLGVFEGGAMEDMLLQVTGLGLADEDSTIATMRNLVEALQGDIDPRAIARAIGLEIPENMPIPDEMIEQLKQFAAENLSGISEVLKDTPKNELIDGVDESTWKQLRPQLEAAGLIRVEIIKGHGVPFLKFHPTLARVLWASLGEEEQDPLQRRHRERYYALSGYLYHEDDKNPYAVRAIAQRELPNLLVAVRGAMDAGEDWAVEFVNNVNRFLMVFGMNVDRKALTDRAEQLAKSVAVGSWAWYLARSNAGEQLQQSGQPQRAIVIFQEILAGLGETVSFNRGQTLGWLGRCGQAMGQPAQAATLYRQALEDLGQLEPSDGVKWEMGVTQADLGNVLTDVGDYGAARQAYEGSLAIKQKIGGEERGVAVVNGQLGILAMLEGNLAEAETRYQSALTTFRRLDEPEMEATAWHQLGVVYQEAKDWEQSEQAYRAAAKLWDEQGNLANAAKTANQLAIVCEYFGKPKEAEAWYRKAIEADRKVGNPIYLAKHLNNLANLLQTQGNLTAAQSLAEEAIAIMQTLDPAAAEIWITYNILAQIATRQGAAAKAQAYRRQSRQSYAAFAGSRQMLTQWEGFIQGAVVAMSDADVRQQLEAALPQMPAPLATAMQRILAGARDEDELCDELDFQYSLIVGEILRRL